MKTQKCRLMWHGMLLFLLGLITGLLEQPFTNVRMSLLAHLEGVMNRILLLTLGAAWNGIRLPHPVVAVGFLTVAIAIIATPILVLWALRGTATEVNDTWEHLEFNIPPRDGMKNGMRASDACLTAVAPQLTEAS